MPMKRVWAAAGVLCVLGVVALAGEEPPPPPPSDSPPPIPLHTIEGTSGVYLTSTAIFANMPEGEGPWGKPSVALSGVKLGHKELVATTITTNLFRRVELGYSWMRLGLGDWHDDVRTATGLNTKGAVRMHTLSARLQIIRDGEWDMGWMPAVAAGVHWKHNDSINEINDDLIVPGVFPRGAVRALGLDDNDGWEFTLVASKIIADPLPRPFLVSAGLRTTEANQIGLLGFTDDYDTVFEGHVACLVTDRLIMGAEYRQKPNNLGRLAGLVGREDDWWTLEATYLLTNKLTVTAAYAHLGKILNHDENASWALQVKWEF